MARENLDDYTQGGVVNYPTPTHSTSVLYRKYTKKYHRQEILILLAV
jgi:hypothetical protein